MAGGIYLVQDDGRLVEMRDQPYDSEDLLQGLLATYPSLLAGDQIDSAAPRRWLLVSREAAVPSEDGGTGRWAVDHVFLDQDAIPTLVEVKRSTDTRIRREVVGQMLDYAANAVVYWPVEAIRAQFEAASPDPEQTLAEFLDGEAEPEQFWQQVKTNLQAGKVRLIFVADVIPPELQRIVEFLNVQMDPAEVLAVEIKQYAGQGLRTLVPRVIGQTAKVPPVKSTTNRNGRQWDEPSFFQDLEARRGAGDTQIARRILEWARDKGLRVTWGKGKEWGSYIPILNHKGRDHQLFAMWTVGTVEIYFYWYQYKPPFDDEVKLRELHARINQTPGVNIPSEMLTRRPTIRLSILQEEAALAKFLAAFDWFIEQIKAS